MLIANASYLSGFPKRFVMLDSVCPSPPMYSTSKFNKSSYFSNQLGEKDHAKKSVWLNIYNASDNFLSSTYQPLLEKYDDLLNLDVEYIGGDGQTESNITNRLGNPDKYDAFAINMVKTDNAASYTGILK